MIDIYDEIDTLNVVEEFNDYDIKIDDDIVSEIKTKLMIIIIMQLIFTVKI